MDFAKEFNKLGKNSNIDNIVSQFKEVDSSVIDMAKSVKDGSMSMDEFTEKSTKATTTTSRFSSVAKSVGTAIKSIGATAANMIGGFLIAEGISLAIQGIYNLVNADKIAIENGQKAQQEIKEVFDTYNGKVDTVKSLGKKFAQDADSIKTTGDAVESLTQKYAELRKGVSSDNTNLTLSDKEYQEYLDISNQLAESFPSLVSGSDAAGNSILNLGDNASIAADKMERLLKTQMTLAHNDIIDKSRDTFRGAFEEADNIEDEIKSLKGQEKQLKESASQISLSRDEIREQLKSGHLIFKDMSKTDADKMEKALGAYVGKELGRVRRSDVSLDGHTIDRIEFTIDPVVDENKLNEATDMIEARVLAGEDELAAKKGEIQSNIKAQEQKQKEVWNSFAESTVKPYLETSAAISDMPVELLSAVESNLQNLDWKKLYKEYGGDADQMLLDELVSPLNSLEKPAQEALTKALSLDPSTMSIAEYNKAIDSALKEVSDNKTTRKEWKNRFFKSVIDSATEDANALKEQFKGIDKEIDNLSGEDRELAYQIAIEDEDFDGTWQDVMDKIEVMKEEAENPMTFNLGTFTTEVGDAIALIDTLNAALANSYSGKGLSVSYEVDEETGVVQLTGDIANLQAAYSDLEGYDPSTLFERTANGVHINREALRQLQAQEEALNKSKWLEDEKNLTDQLAVATNKLANAKNSGSEADVASAQATVDSLQQQLEQVQLLSAAYDGATSSYQQWINAQSAGEEGDMFRTVSETMKSRGDQLYNEGRYNTEEFRAVADYFSNEDLSTAPVENLVAAYENAANARERYFTGNKQGIDNFMADMQNDAELMSKGIVKTLEDGSLEFQAGSDKILADKFHLSEEAIQSILRAASEYTDGIKIGKIDGSEDFNASIDEMKSKADEAKGKLEELKNAGNQNLDLNFNFDSTNLEDLDAQIERAKTNLDQFKNSDGQIDLSVDGAEEAVTILQTLIQQKVMVSQPAIMSIDTTGLDEATAETVSKLQEFQTQLDTINSLEMQQDLGIQVDTNQLDAAKAKAQELFSELQGKSEDGSLEITPDVKVDTGSMESLEQSLSSMTPEIKAKIVPDGNVSDTLVAGDIKVEDQTAKVDYVKGSQEAPADRTAAVDYIKKGTTQIEPANKSAAVTYSKIGGEQAPPSDKNANVNYKKGEQEAPSKKNAVVDYKRGSQELPDSPKTATVNYTLGTVATPPDAYVKVHYDTSGKPKGSSPANGTAHSQGTANPNSGHAFSSGSWGLKQPEKGALINELGAEIIVRNGQWFVENNGYPTITNLKKNDIVFNHEQSKALLERGYVTGSHAKLAYEGNSHAKGTAFSGGSWTFGNTGGGNIGGTNSSTSNNLNSASNNLAKAASDTSKAASDTSEAAEKLSEAVSGYTDWVEVLFQRLESQYDLLMSQMERIAHLPDKQQKLYEAMSKNSELLNRTQQAIGTYQSHFDSIVQQSGINPLIVHQIQNGSMDISKYDQDTQKIISELQSYYDKLVDCNKQYDDLLNKQSELAQTALDNIEDYIDMMTGIESSAVDYQEALRELAAAKGESAYSDNMYGSLQESIKNQQDVAGKLQSQIKSYQDEINKLMANGYMAEYSTEWFEAQAALNGFRQEAAEAEKTLIELQDQLRELDLLKLQQVIDELDRTAKRLENNSDLTESKGEQVPEKDLQAQLDNANAQIQANYDKRNELLKDQAKYDVGSDKYNEYAEEIEKLDDAIFDAMENIEDLKNKIWEVRWQPFFDGQEVLGDLIDQTDDLRGLLNSDAFLDKNGGLTVDGIANLALISQGMNAAKQQIKNYQEALKKLDEDLKNGNISTEEFEEQQKDFLDQISSSVNIVEDYKDSIVDLYTKMLEQENEVAQKSIDKQKELLDIKKKNADYNKTLRKQARDVNTLKAQIAALEGTNNASAQAELKRLKAQLRDAEEEMQDTRDDHEYDVRQNGLDGLSEDLDKQLEETLYDVTHNAEKQEQVISQMLGNIVGNYQQAYDKIQQIINSTGFVPNNDLSNNLGNLGTSNGAQDQVDNSMTNAPNYRPDDWTDVNTGQIQNGTTQDKNDQIQGDISKNPDLSNRPVAEIILIPGTLSIQEGSTANISATIRPNDAKNKSLQWMSSNPDVAAVVNGTVRAIKTGSATISAIATDGGGATSSNSCAVTVTPKPEPPKPTPPQNKPNTGGGDGVPNVGDKVIFASGKYFYSSDGKSPAGNELLGQEVYITSVNNASWAQKKYHISRTPRFGERDLGWVSLDQLKGYASGTKKIANAEEVARVNEGNKRELLIRYGSATGNAAVFHYGDSVVKADLANNIVELAKNKDDIFQTLNSANLHQQPTTINYDGRLVVQGDIDKDVFPGVKAMCEESYKYTTKKLTQEAHRMGMHRTL